MAQISAAAVQKFVKAGVPAGKQHSTLRDGTGLALRLRTSGEASWLFIYRRPGEGRTGQQKMMTIGRWPEVDVTLAKQLALAAKHKLLSGIDPAVERKEQARQEKLQLKAALDDYEAWIRSRRLIKVTEMMSGLRRGFQPLMRKALDEIDRRAMVAAIERIEHHGRPGAAADFRKLAAAFLNRQVSLGTLKVSPLTGYRRPKMARDDVAEAELAGKALSPEEIVKVWNAAETIGGSFGNLVKMALATGLRRGELANLRWSWVDRQNGTITIPAKAMKMGSEHSVIIGDLVGRILDDVSHRGSDLIFPGRRLGAMRPMSGWSKLLKRLRALSGVEAAGLHNCRRTFRSALSDLGVEEAVAEVMIAHQRRDLVRRYNRAGLLRQRRQAATTYDAWLAGLLGITEDNHENVVRVPRPEP